MKIKLDFVTNSSSASFTIPKEFLTEKQILMIYSHVEIGSLLSKDQNVEFYADEWDISEKDGDICGDTSMDNFDMTWFLENIGVDMNRVTYNHSNDMYYDNEEW
jgi:hypothetical protein